MSDFENEKNAVKAAIIGYRIPEIIESVNSARAAGLPATTIIESMSEGMTQVGLLFERGKLFLPQVLSASSGMTQAVELLRPELLSSGVDSQKLGKVVMGTVEGDVHDIGKSIVSTMLQCAGFEIRDMGRDVPTRVFIEEIKNGCNFCGMSALMTTTMVVQKEVIQQLKAQGLREKVTVMVGGAPVTQHWADKIGADVYAETASEASAKAKAAAQMGE
jgi:dimethylamine corrinoid protein